MRFKCSDGLLQRVAHVQRQPERGQVAGVAAEDRLRQREKLALLVEMVLENRLAEEFQRVCRDVPRARPARAAQAVRSTARAS
ncbi:hypothetical protein [Aromatoleum bremense]|uniref:Transposase n=1 Tax=Aromatoleum bremense TaxID=76115 RepID=A0ABX1NQK5_9RHOO|nr:hypothetical protein [Aromatoleum bremense]NMG14264.1 hypothetical protein [Aromatoleum bremense]